MAFAAPGAAHSLDLNTIVSQLMALETLSRGLQEMAAHLRAQSAALEALVSSMRSTGNLLGLQLAALNRPTL